MKCVILSPISFDPRAPFHLHRLGLHENHRPKIVNRPQGTGDYLFILFHSDVTVKSREGLHSWESTSLMIWKPGDGHFYGNTSCRWLHSWFHCAGPTVRRLLQENHIPTGRRIIVTDPSVMEKFLLEMVAEHSVWSRADSIVVESLFVVFIRKLARQIFRQTESHVPSNLLAVQAYVEQHFTEELNLTALAQLAGWSPSHLCAEFKRFFGAPIIHYALQLRMNHAAFLLRDHNRRIGEIAEASGHRDIYTFSKLFRRYFGVSPRLFRELNTKEQSACLSSVQTKKL